MAIRKVKTRSGLQGWRAQLQENYDRSFDQFEAYCDSYNLHERLGFTSAQAAWDANPMIEGSVDPADFCKIGPCGMRIFADEPGLVTASFKMGDHEVKDIPVLNPGDWFGKAWVLQVAIANALNPFYVVEADSEGDAIDILAEHEDVGHVIAIDVEADGDDYGEELSGLDDDSLTDKQRRQMAKLLKAGHKRDDLMLTLSGKVIKGGSTANYHTSGQGVHYNADNLHIYGNGAVYRGKGPAYPVIYHGAGIPEAGVSPVDFYNHWEWKERSKLPSFDLSECPEGSSGMYLCKLVKSLYPDGLCPDCRTPIPDDMERGEDCEECGKNFE